MTLPRYRDSPVSYSGKLPIYCTHIDYTQAPESSLANYNLPHAFLETSRLLYKAYNTTETKTNYWCGGQYDTNYHTDFYPNSPSRYWINSRGDRAISWDTDSLYYKGKGKTIVSYNDNHPHNAAHDFIDCAALNNDVITQNDYDIYVTQNPSLPSSVIGKKRFVVIKNYYTYKLEIWAILETTAPTILNLVKCYGRTLTELNATIADGFVFKGSYLSGFMGDGLSLIFNFKEWDDAGNGNSANDGLFKCVFSRDYTTQTFIKLANDVYPVVTDTRTLTVTPIDPELNEVSATINQTLVDGGLSIEQIFVHQDDITVIMRTKESHSQVESYYRNDGTGVETINSSYNYVSAFKPHKLVNGSLVDTGVVLFRHQETGTETANDDSNGFNQINDSSAYDIEARCLFANAEKGLYVYQTFVESWHYTYIGDPPVKTVEWSYTIKTILRHNNVEMVIDEYNEYVDTPTNNNEIVNPSNYSNSSSTYAEEWSYINADTMSYAFDNKTLISCFNAHWAVNNTFIGNIRPHTLIVNTKNDSQYTKLDYRVDTYVNGNGNWFIFPLSVTN